MFTADIVGYVVTMATIPMTYTSLTTVEFPDIVGWYKYPK